MSVEEKWCAYDKFVSSQEPRYEANGNIQWKGVDACIDLSCVCGAAGHVDGEFLFRVECAFCGRVYALAHTVKLVELTGAHKTFIQSLSDGVVRFGIAEERK